MSKTSIKKVHENLLDVWIWKNLKPSKHSLSFDVCIIRHICFVGKLVLSLTLPNFLTGAIMQTRFQTSLPAPPGFGVSTMQSSLPTTHQRREEIMTTYMLGLNCLKASVIMNIGLSMLWFNFILGLNFIFLCFKLIIIYYHSPKQRK